MSVPVIHKIKDIQVEWVESLPRLNLRDAILATPEAAQQFQSDLKEFFPVFKERYFLPRALKESTHHRIFLFLGMESSRYLQKRELDIRLHRYPLPHDLDVQRRLVQEWFSPIDSFSGLGDLLHHHGMEYFHATSFLSMMEKPFSLEEYLLALNGPEKYLYGPKGRITVTALRMLAGRLFEKRRFLWPLWPIEGEQRWPKFVIDYGYPFGHWLLRPFSETPHLRDQQSMLLVRTLRATTWSSWKDITDEDIALLRDKIRSDSSASYATTLNHIVRKARELGNPLMYETRGTRLSKTKYRGRDGPSFAFFQDAAQKSSIVGYWVNQAGHFYRFEKDQGQRQRLDPLNRALSSWLDYVCELDRIGQAPSSMSEVTNRLHIRLPGPGWTSSFPSFTTWGRNKGVGRGRVWSDLILVRQFFAWIIRNEDLHITVPVDDFDLPSRPQSRKSHRPALTIQCWKELRTLILEDPVPVTERFQDASGKRIEVPSPTFQTYLLIRLETGIRDMQARYLDKNKVLGKDGFVISGDKNIHRKVLQVIPYFDPALKEKVQQCIDYQNTYNHPTEPVWYGGNENSPFGKVDPLFRFISHSGDPICALTFKIYFMKTLLKYQKKAGLAGNHQLVRSRGGTAIDMSTLDPDSLSAVEVLDRFTTPFDLHSLRVTAATVWFEAGLPLPVILDFITGHTTLSMLLHYIQVRNAEQSLKDRFSWLTQQQEQEKGQRQEIEQRLGQDLSGTLTQYRLTSRYNRAEDKNLDGIQALLSTAGSGMRVLPHGICPTGSCPNGLDGRCGLCPLLITGPAFKTGIVAQFNLVAEQALLVGASLRRLGDRPTAQQAEIESLVQQLAGWSGWLQQIETLEKKASENSEGKLILHSQLKWNLEQTSPTLHQLQRCWDIQLAPEVWTDQAYYQARKFLTVVLSQLPASEDPLHIVERMLPEKAVQLVAAYYQRLIELGKSQGEIEAAFTDSRYVLSPEDVLPLLAEIAASPASQRKELASGSRQQC